MRHLSEWPLGRAVQRPRTPTAFMALACSLAVLIGCSDGSQKGGLGWDVGAIFAGHTSRHDGEEWTILCLEVTGENRVRTCDELAAALRRVPQLDPSKADIEHAGGVSKIRYGIYHRRLDAKREREGFGPEFLRDMQLIRSLAAGERFPFAAARVVPKPTPNPGRPEWEITHCPGVYTLHVGVFYNTATFGKRKESATRWVEELRKEGVEAYYLHGQVRSSVTVGHFGEGDIIREQVGPRNNTANTRVRYSEKIQALRRQGRFKYNLENGHKVKRTTLTVDGPRESYRESFVIPVPKPEPVEAKVQ